MSIVLGKIRLFFSCPHHGYKSTCECLSTFLYYYLLLQCFSWNALQCVDSVLLVCAKPKPFNSVSQGHADLTQYHAK